MSLLSNIFFAALIGIKEPQNEFSQFGSVRDFEERGFVIADTPSPLGFRGSSNTNFSKVSSVEKAALQTDAASCTSWTVESIEGEQRNLVAFIREKLPAVFRREMPEDLKYYHDAENLNEAIDTMRRYKRFISDEVIEAAGRFAELERLRTEIIRGDLRCCAEIEKGKVSRLRGSQINSI